MLLTASQLREIAAARLHEKLLCRLQSWHISWFLSVTTTGPADLTGKTRTRLSRTVDHLVVGLDLQVDGLVIVDRPQQAVQLTRGGLLGRPHVVQLVGISGHLHAHTITYVPRVSGPDPFPPGGVCLKILYMPRQ